MSCRVAGTDRCASWCDLTPFPFTREMVFTGHHSELPPVGRIALLDGDENECRLANDRLFLVPTYCGTPRRSYRGGSVHIPGADRCGTDRCARHRPSAAGQADASLRVGRHSSVVRRCRWECCCRWRLVMTSSDAPLRGRRLPRAVGRCSPDATPRAPDVCGMALVSSCWSPADALVAEAVDPARGACRH
jgi:hypothetical protein